jgi:hypothetical protein
MAFRLLPGIFDRAAAFHEAKNKAPQSEKQSGVPAAARNPRSSRRTPQITKRNAP